ncbi:MAG: PQQ-like beta-propeller repeat protein [Thermoanaerobaculia bacterium]|nr:PQQ-like beta-propeller repeat protein [Thermoanaerobaculia bacterium]
MPSPQPTAPGPSRRLRLWPGVVAVIAMWIARFGIKLVVPGFDGFSRAMMTSFVCAGLVLLWWLFFSRAAWIERLGGLVVLAGGLAGTWWLRDESAGPVWLLGYVVPVLWLTFVGWAVLTRNLPDRTRRLYLVATVLGTCGAWLMFRTSGVDGDHDSSFAWRWAKTAEERLLEASGDGSGVAAPMGTSDAPASSSEWPGFRGPGRDGVARSMAISTDWSATPPQELWRRPVGPGWSSFAVRGEVLYTQEQRGADEVVSCYSLATGQEVWLHRDPVRFFESNAGAGPRGTPTLEGDTVYSFGATGILNALDASNGTVRWSRDVARDSDVGVPEWGFSSSPLVVDDLVVVAASGRLMAYGRGTGELRWQGEKGGVSYSSPQLAWLDGTRQVVLMHGRGILGVEPAGGAVLWQHDWPGFPMVQPELTGDGDILVSASQSAGVRRLAITRDDDTWQAEERWTSLRLKPYFNHFVIHDGHAYGFDGRILAAIDLTSGERRWKGGRFGNGQMILLPEQDLLLVLSEKGQIALVSATPEEFRELGRVSALDGKTWNHPVLVGDVLLVRNAEEMAAYRLAAGDA